MSETDDAATVSLTLIRPDAVVSASGRGLILTQTCLVCGVLVSKDTFARGNARAAKLVGMRHAVQAVNHLASHGIAPEVRG